MLITRNLMYSNPHSDRRTQGRAKANGMSSVRKMCRGLRSRRDHPERKKAIYMVKKNCVPAAESVWEACPFGLMVKS